MYFLGLFKNIQNILGVNACKKVGQTYGDFTDRGECCVGGFCVQSPVNNR